MLDVVKYAPIRQGAYEDQGLMGVMYSPHSIRSDLMTHTLAWGKLGMS